jgi:hypothetical protein
MDPRPTDNLGITESAGPAVNPGITDSAGPAEALVLEAIPVRRKKGLSSVSMVLIVFGAIGVLALGVVSSVAAFGLLILQPRLDQAKEDADRAKAYNIATVAMMFMVNAGDDHVPNTNELTQSDGDKGKPLLAPNEILDRNGQPFQISQAQDRTIVVRSSTPGKDGLPIGNWKKGAQPPR